MQRRYMMPVCLSIVLALALVWPKLPAVVAQATGEPSPTPGVQFGGETPVVTPVPTVTPTPSSEPTLTPTFAIPDEPTFTPEPTLTPTFVVPDEPTSTLVPSPTATPTTTPSPTSTATTLPSATPTLTPLWPTDTPTPSPTWSPTPACADGWEPNPQAGDGPVLVVDQAIGGLTLYPQGDVDFFLLWAKGGRYYQVTTATGDGLDTRLQIFDPPGHLVAENDDFEAGNPAAQVRFQAPGEGWFAVKVDSRVPTDWGCRQYSISAVDVSPPTPTATATPGPPPPSPTATGTPTPVPGPVQPDAYEPNWDFDTAANLGVGQTVNLNFNPYPPGAGGIDNDYFRLYVKVGERLRLETSGLAEGLDTNLILYRDNGALIAGNDDCLPGERFSCIEWAPDYSGVAYLLAGPVGTIPEAIASGSRAYSLVVTDIAGQTPTPAPGGAWPTPTAVYGQALPWPVTPLPPTPSGVPVSAMPPASATPEAQVQVRPIAVGPPTPTPKPRQPVTIDLSVAAPDEVRISVPYLGYNQAVRPPGKALSIRLVPMRLPSLIP